MKKKFLIVLSFIATLTVVGWMITDFYGGMIIYLIMYSWIIIPMLIIYAVSAIITLVKVVTNGIKSNKFIFYIHVIGLLMILLFNIYQSELFKSRILIDATLNDDLSCINLILRENGRFETISHGMFGYTDKISGKYQIKNDTIIFLNNPYDNDYIPNRVIIDKKDNAIYFKKELNGEFSRKRTFVNYFEINKICTMDSLISVHP